MKDRYFSPRRTSASHQPCPTERMVNPWYFTQLRLPVYKHGYMRRFHPYPCSKRRRKSTDPWMVLRHVSFLSPRSLTHFSQDGFLQESTIRPTEVRSYLKTIHSPSTSLVYQEMYVEDEDEDESDRSDAYKDKGIIYLLVVEVCILSRYLCYN